MTLFKDRKAMLILIGTLLVFVFILFAQIQLLTRFEFGDEHETIVAAKMMAAGSNMFKDIFNHHGPMTFFPGLIVEFFGFNSIVAHRIPILLLQLAFFLSIYFSHLEGSKTIYRLITVLFTATIVIAFYAPIFGSMYMYQSVTGILSGIIIVVYLIPRIIGLPINKYVVIISNIAIVSIFFLAVTYLPAVLLFFIAGFDKRQLKETLLGIFVGLIFNVLFICIFCDFSGYFAYHFYLNLNILSPDNSLFILITNVLRYLLKTLQGFFSALYLVIVSIMLNKLSEREFNWRTIVCILGVMSFLVRGASFGYHGLPYWYSLLGFGLVFESNYHEFLNQNRQMRLFPQILNIICVAIAGIFCLWLLVDTKNTPQYTTHTEFSDFAKAITSPDEKILSLTFQNGQYIFADRLPASGNYFYLPWQAYYNQNPMFGQKIDLVEDLLREKPKVIFADKYSVSDVEQHAWLVYADDVDTVINENYHQIPGKPYYVRKDAEYFSAPSHLTDENWDNGILRSDSKVVLFEDNLILSIADKLALKNGNELTITKIRQSGRYVCVFFNSTEDAITATNADELRIIFPNILLDEINQSTPNGKHVGEIIGNDFIRQSFRANMDNLCEIRVLLATFTRDNSCTVSFKLYDDANNLLDETIINASELDDNAYYRYKFNEVADSKDRVFSLVVSSVNAEQGNAITAWCTDSVFGELYVNGELQNQNIIIILVYDVNENGYEE